MAKSNIKLKNITEYDPRFRDRIRLYKKVARELRYYDAGEVADLAGVSYQCVVNYRERAVELPHRSSLERVAAAIGLGL